MQSTGCGLKAGKNSEPQDKANDANLRIGWSEQHFFSQWEFITKARTEQVMYSPYNSLPNARRAVYLRQLASPEPTR